MWQEFERTRHDVCGRWEWEWDNYEQSVLDYDVCPFCVELEVVDSEKRKNRKSMTGVSYYYRPLDPTDPDERRLLTNGH